MISSPEESDRWRCAIIEECSQIDNRECHD
jgi:hypothetical protein